MVGTKVKLDYNGEVYEVVKIREVGKFTYVDFKDVVGNIGTANARIFKTLNENDLMSEIKKKEEEKLRLEASSSVEATVSI